MEQFIPLEQLNNIAEIDIIYKRKANVKLSQRPCVQSSRGCYELLLHYWNPDKLELQEEVKVMFLNRSNRVLAIMSLSSGGITGCVVDPRLVMAAAIKMPCCGIIIAHNHPSGALTPSKADEEITKKLKSAAEFFDITLLDHLVITAEHYYSFADEGLL